MSERSVRNFMLDQAATITDQEKTIGELQGQIEYYKTITANQEQRIATLTLELTAAQGRETDLRAALEAGKMRILELQALLGWHMELPIEKRYIDPKWLGEQIDAALAK